MEEISLEENQVQWHKTTGIQLGSAQILPLRLVNKVFVLALPLPRPVECGVWWGFFVCVFVLFSLPPMGLTLHSSGVTV